MNSNLKNNASNTSIVNREKSITKNTKNEQNEINKPHLLTPRQSDKKNINISEMRREKEYLTAVKNDFISNIHNYVPLKSAISNVSEKTYYKTIGNALLEITEQRHQLNEKKKLESTDKFYLWEEKITNSKNNLAKYLYDHSENKENNLISQDLSTLLDEIYNTDVKIKSIEASLNEKENNEKLTNTPFNNKNQLDTESLLSSSMASLKQNTMTSDFKHSSSNNKQLNILIPMRD
ncbi:hypothetical protein G9396_14180 [Providencia rettgeri]|uniref:hypothetical protein n=1 Tax=Providencia rettgeri TaxID=587 RepID=UPI00159960DD|nr:hypothetical protein [Providencia rettgeri]MBQ0688658.1 hypothetical protein [Providencia rettgeri]MCY0803126.1 hypothetical protein [Providencia rettgeri]QKJ51480.1 hypothetical protein G9396_14180 [Providencia rettgeri]